MIQPFIHHEPKSRFAYLFDADTVHLRVEAAKGTVDTIRVRYGDPFHWGPNTTDPDRWEWKRDDGDATTMIQEYQTEHFDHFFVAVRPPTKRMRYAFVLNDRFLFGSHGLIDLEAHPAALDDHHHYFNFPFLNEEDRYVAPRWVQDQIWYSIFPERFRNGDPGNDPAGTLPWGATDHYSNHQTFGGDLEGILQGLDHIASMGFTGLYLTPIFPSDSNHKYDVNDYFDIDPSFGDLATFDRLIEAAHQKGLKVMLDAVFNHCGVRHPFFQDVLRQGKQSPYYDGFYLIDPRRPVLPDHDHVDGIIDRQAIRRIHKDKSLLNYRTFAFTPAMPKIKTMFPLWRDHLLEVAQYWITEHQIDGWRLDVSDEVPHAFWRLFRQRVKDADPDSYIVGENWTNATPWLQGDQYDGVMNYELLFAIWNYFADPAKRNTVDATTFTYQVNRVLTTYPKHVLQNLYNLVDSHDTTRILTICGDDALRVRLPYVFLFSFPGTPSVFYGGEIGLAGEHDPDNRRCMPWDPEDWNLDLKRHIQRLIELRKTHQAFRSVDLSWHTEVMTSDVVVYQKDDVLFALSRADKPTTLTLPTSWQDRPLHDLYRQRPVPATKTLPLAPFGFVILK
jgi:glycosidase